MDDAAVVAGLVQAERVFLFEEEKAAAGIGSSSRMAVAKPTMLPPMTQWSTAIDAARSSSIVGSNSSFRAKVELSCVLAP